jgi:serine/threonine protein kinase/Flp pilus assembly protein TadD
MQRLGNYEIVREVGRGGMGVVYEALDEKLGRRRVALKVILNAGRTRQDVERFRREATSAARLDGPGVVRVFDFGEIEGRPYIAMEFVDGRSFDDLIRSAIAPPEVDSVVYVDSAGVDPEATARLLRPKPPPAAPPPETAEVRRATLRRHVAILSAAARALHFAHEKGVLHRDVKPANMLVADGDVVKLADFGLARLESHGDTLTGSGEILGTLAYMAPEQISGKKIPLSRRTDIYALGVTLYEVLTGRRPFDGDSAATMMQKIQTDDPPRPRRVATDVPCDLETICLRAIEKDPERRFATASDFADELDRWLQNAPILSRAAGPMTRFLKFAVRRRVPIVFALLLIVGGLATATAIKTVRKNEELAREARTRSAREKLEASLMRSLAGSPKDVLKLLDEAHAEDPDNVDVLLQRGLLYMNVDEMDAALADFEAGLRARPNDEALRFAKAVVLDLTGVDAAPPKLETDRIDDHVRLTAVALAMLAHGRVRDSLAAFERAKTLSPTWPQTYFGLAVGSFYLGRFEDAARHVETFNTLTPRHLVGRCLAVAVLSQAAAQAKGARREDLLRRAEEASEAIGFPEAIPLVAATRATFVAVAATDPAEVAAAFDVLDAKVEAAVRGDQSLSRSIVYEVAAIALVERDPARARRYAEEALKVRKGTERASYVVARAAELSKDRETAAAAYRALLARLPDAVAAAAAVCREAAGASGLFSDAEALDAAERVVACKPDSGSAHMAAGAIFERAGRAEDAAEAFRTAERRYRAAHDDDGVAAAKTAAARVEKP